MIVDEHVRKGPLLLPFEGRDLRHSIHSRWNCSDYKGAQAAAWAIEYLSSRRPSHRFVVLGIRNTHVELDHIS